MSGVRKAEALDAHLERAVDGAGFWGELDCFLWPADWVVLSGWPDPAGPWRGRYRTALGAARIAAAAGGVEALWIAGALRSGLAPTFKPVAGDVGLLALETRDAGPTLARRVGAICIGPGRWALRTATGYRDLAARPIRAWRTPWRTR